MCVICFTPKGVKTPSNEILKAMYQTNPHGTGFCTPTMFHKGLSFDYFMQNIRKRDISEPCIIHFRLATNGSIKKANCHPFKQGDVYFAHNGILNIRAKGDMTDSETAFIYRLYPIIQQYGLKSKELDRAVKRIIGYSKFAFMQDDHVRLYGDFQKWQDCYFSNLRFLHRLYSFYQL